MPATQTAIEVLADRIQHAYRLRRLGWHGTCSTPRIWTVAAELLLSAHGTDDALPVDPELFVAAQPRDSPFLDPWSELTRPDAVVRYRQRVAAIIRGLHGELAGEVRHVERRVALGESVATILLSRSRRLSALGRYLIAQRAGRPALAARFRHGAVAQHRACPLYRQASAGLIPADAYPVPKSGEPQTEAPAPPSARVKSEAQWN